MVDNDMGNMELGENENANIVKIDNKGINSPNQQGFNSKNSSLNNSLKNITELYLKEKKEGRNIIESEDDDDDVRFNLIINYVVH